MALSDNYSYPSTERLAMLINEHSGLNVVYGVDFVVDHPKPYGYGLQYNTSVVIRWLTGPIAGRAERIFYRRLSFDTINQSHGVPVLKICEPGFHINDILDLLNAHFGTQFVEGELVNDFIDEENISYECRPTDTSLAWHGGKLLFNIDFVKPHLSDAAPVSNLDGLYPPENLPFNMKPITPTQPSELNVQATTMLDDGLDSIWQ